MQRYRNFKATAAIAGLVFLGSLAAAQADTFTTFDLSGVTFSEGGTATGSFVFDSTNNHISNINIVTTSGTFRDGQNVAHTLPGFTYDSTSTGHVVSGAGFFDFIFDTVPLTAQLTLGVAASPSLTVASPLLVFGNESSESSFTSPFPFRDINAGSIVPEVVGSQTPLPGALPLFASGLAGFGMIGWRRKRKAIAAAS